METEDGGATHPNVDNGTRVGHDGSGSGSGADAGDLPGGELDLLGELVGGSCQDLQLLGQCCCCWLEDPQLLLGPHGLRNGSCWWSFQASKPASLLHTLMHLQALLRSCTDVAILKIDSFSAKFPDDTHCKTFVFFSGPNLINLKLSNPEH